VSVALSGGCFAGDDRRLDTGATLATVYVADLNASEFVDRHVKEVEQVPANIRATLCPNTTTLHRRVRCRIGGGPSEPAIESVCDIKMPYAFEVGLERVTRSNCPVECDCGSTGIAGDCGRITYVLQTIDIRNVDQILPGRAVIGRSRDRGLCVVIRD